MIRNILGTIKVGPVLHVFVSEDQGLLCIDVEVSSHCMILHGYEKAVELHTMSPSIVRIRTRN